MAATMTPAFGLQQPEDSMEISSEYGNMDADIDIDLDGAPDSMHFVQDDHQMIDDPKSDHADDVMVDDPINVEDNDRVMQDDAVPQEHDEELLDFSDGEDDIQIDVQEQPQQLEIPSQPTITIDEPIEQVQSEVATELLTEGVEPVTAASPQRQQDVQSQPDITEHTSQQHFSPPTADTTTNSTDTVLHDSHHQSIQSEPQAAQAPPTTEAEVQNQPTEVLPQEPRRESITETTELAHPEHDENVQQTHDESGGSQYREQQGNDDNIDLTAPEDKSDEQPALHRIDTEVSAYDETEDASRERQGNSPTVTGLHPTVVEYDGNEVYLFPSRDPVVSEQYLLDNENLVTTSLGDLLQACRTALGDGITEDEELVLGVEELDLYVSEDSTPAFSTSFQELLDIYLQLHRLDGNDTPPPFRVSLSTKTRFTNRLTLITQAISEGKGFSQLSFLQYYQYDEPTELPDEDFDDDFDETAEVFQDHVSDHAEQQGQESIETSQTATKNIENESHEQTEQESEPTHNEQANLNDLTGNHEGEYEGEKNAQSDESTEAIDNSESHQEETQYFDAQGEVQDQSGSQQEGEAEANQGDATGADEDDSYLDYENNDNNQDESATRAEHESASPGHGSNDAGSHVREEQSEEQLEHVNEAGADEEQEFGLGEFFDENSYEYTENDNDANEQQEESFNAEEYGEGEGLEQSEAAQPSADGVEQDEQSVDVRGDEVTGPSDLYDEVTDVPDSHDQTKEVHQEDDAGVDISLAKDGETTEDVSAFLENDEEDHTAQAATSAGDDFDEINFDDEDGYEDELQSGLAPETASGSSRPSPAGKRSFSERGEIDDDEQDNKKARAE